MNKFEENGKHIEEDPSSSDAPMGTPNFMSRNAHKGNQLARRDDMESLLYMVLVLINGYTAW